MCDSYLTEKQIEDFRLKLIEKRNSIHESLTHKPDFDAEKSPDPLDRAAQTEEMNANKARSEQQERALKEVNFALANFEEFGYCLSCGEEIGLARLNYNPAFTKCVDCKELEERKARG
ncbi:TraR/DksA family transcriptional regulator [Vibrio owensii]|uniref:TraR/DksA family transcriptional regulator n=1 Tax=Vibrio harveyi group TaxID=717610 RepID=UPI003CC65226